MDIKPIETHYNGYRFRSRLEARWAVFFDTLGIEYQYEPEGYQLPSGWYLPDFWLPVMDVWVEVKAAYPSWDEQQLCNQLFCMTNKPVLIGYGPPTNESGKGLVVICADLTDGSGGHMHWNASWAADLNGRLCINSGNDRWDRTFQRTASHDGVFEMMKLAKDCAGPIADKYCAPARQARFEHGETPVRRGSR